ncbi:endoglucanase 12-like [Salvia hispanica]|uniref:endoglucanase 12-like n=1 Tax=Salvia hispanica TaxID=49212 RepID=UPI0020094DD2|nr:endoglucanase 12-like [Salvia hispanica]
MRQQNKYLCMLKWAFLSILIVIGLPITEANSEPKDKPSPHPLPDNYAAALHKALLFFDAQKSGKLGKENRIPWRGNSGLRDGSGLTDVIVEGGLVGGYYDAGDNAKFHFPMAFSVTMLSWSVIEYEHKYRANGEYNHVRDLIKWGADYLLLTFNSSPKINQIYTQVGGSRPGSTNPDDNFCWQRPEDMEYPRPVQTTTSGPDLAGEMAAALAATSIVFRDNHVYSKKLAEEAKNVFTFARDPARRAHYSTSNPFIEPYYNSTGYYDEYIWGAVWLFYATDNSSYLSLATNPGLARNSGAFNMTPDLRVFSWDNKLPGAMLLLTRVGLFLKPGYPYVDMLNYMHHNITGLTMCSYLRSNKVFNWTQGGMIELNRGKPQNLQYVANAAFLASVYADYLNATGLTGWFCGSTFLSLNVLKDFATLQMNYILGANPSNMSYIVGYGTKFPRHVHHRGASIPIDKTRYSCSGGWRWRDASTPNPNIVTGAMVAGPYPSDEFKDVRTNYTYTEPTLAGNAGFVAALVSLTMSEGRVGSADPTAVPGEPSEDSSQQPPTPRQPDPMIHPQTSSSAAFPLTSIVISFPFFLCIRLRFGLFII